MDNIQVFQDVQFGQLRVIIENEPWFIGKDVYFSLGYARPDNAVTNRTDKNDAVLFLERYQPPSVLQEEVEKEIKIFSKKCLTF